MVGCGDKMAPCRDIYWGEIYQRDILAEIFIGASSALSCARVLQIPSLWPDKT